MNLENGSVYGPMVSRRLGRTLGVNLAPAGHKSCNFNCAYCREEWMDLPSRHEWPQPSDIIDAVDCALETCSPIDTIAVAGNGEPTLHPGFAEIADGLACVRARRAPQARLALLTNGSTLCRLDVYGSLTRFDARRVKFDAGDATTFRLLNAPCVPLGRLIADLRSLNRLTLQSTFVTDSQNHVTNATPSALDAWFGAVRQIKPECVDICTVRQPSRLPLLPVPGKVLERIADVVRSMGFPARVFA